LFAFCRNGVYGCSGLNWINMQTMEDFAKSHRLKIHMDECGNRIIPGRRGNSHLYFDDDQLCLIVLDGPVAIRSRWQALGGQLWLGDIAAGLQDVKVTGIPLANAKLAIQLARVKRKRLLSEKQRQALTEARKKSPIVRQSDNNPQFPSPSGG
jgi:hypothetical protein